MTDKVNEVLNEQRSQLVPLDSKDREGISDLFYFDGTVVSLFCKPYLIE